MKNNFLLKSLMILLLGTISFSVVACAENGDDDDFTPPAEQNGFELEDDDTTEQDEQPGDPGTGQQ